MTFNLVIIFSYALQYQQVMRLGVLMRVSMYLPLAEVNSHQADIITTSLIQKGGEILLYFSDFF